VSNVGRFAWLRVFTGDPPRENEDANHVLNRCLNGRAGGTCEIDAGKVKVGSSWGLSPIISEDNDKVTFGKGLDPPFGEPSGSINRITGQASIYIATMTDGLYNFYGKCKRAEKLF
jgi:hypothetical protein